ncbi:MAG: acyl carrier protein [Planctomycetia bacterium]|nr:acyl carrier protein [Planctomycetia bacterium]
MDVTLDATLAVVRSFAERKRGKAATSIQAGTALLRDGYLDSFALVELIAELEKRLELSLPDGALIPEDFETPQVLFDRLREL